jgi:hypothetical protein
MKICPTCNQEKSLDNFAKCSTRKDGLQFQCKACKIQQNREKGYSKKHYKKTAEEQKAKAKEWFRNNSKKHYAEHVKPYKERNLEKYKQMQDNYTSSLNPGVYAIKCLVNGKMYIGESTYPMKRRVAHLSIAKSDKTLTSTNDWLQEDIQKYGKKSFVFGIIEETLDHKSRELYWIKYFKANNIELYNG